jgi:outer membrane protein insertion porin family
MTNLIRLSVLGLISFLLSFPLQLEAQTIDYTEPKDYEIGGIKVIGAKYSDEKAIVSISGLKVGDRVTIPGFETRKAIKSLYKLRLFDDVQLRIEKIAGDLVFLEIVVNESPRYLVHNIKGIKKSTAEELNEEIAKFLVKGGIVTEDMKANATNAIKSYYREKGYLDIEVDVKELIDTTRRNAVRLTFDIDRGERVKIYDITFSGNTDIPAKKLRKQFEETKRKRQLFSTSKFDEDLYIEDKKMLINYYNTLGYRDARVISDSMWRNEDGQLMLHIDLHEGNQYYFRNITFKGNSIYPDEALFQRLKIQKGDVYNEELLQTRLSFSEDSRDVSSLYMDNGYLFFQVDPVEVAIVGDSLDLELRIFEGPQATIDKVIIKGNDRTHEHVVRRELRTLPGDKFSRSNIIRSQREIVNLGYFNPESLGINPKVNPQRGTVDIEYTVEEKPSDQLELSAGWGGYGRGVIGTLGVAFNNFSVRNIFKKETWSPLPQGDGQRLSIRAQTNGRLFQSYNASFTEPWLGGKKPNALTVAAFHSRFSQGVGFIDFTPTRTFSITGVTFSLGTRLKFPDDNFITSTAINLQTIKLDDWTSSAFSDKNGNPITNGKFNNFSITQTISRSTINNPLFPMEGSSFTLSGQLTLPYSLFRKTDFTDLSVEDQYRWVEYHKWKFKAEWYTTLVGKLTLKTEAKLGLIGAYNKDNGISPFERFQLGGDGLNNQQLGAFNGTDIVSMRGYEVNEIEANQIGNTTSATPIYSKYTMEIRYPVSLNPSSTIYVMAFAQAGNAWQDFESYNPFDLKRTAGMGLRVFLPMFGMLGFDYGFGFDKQNISGDNFFSKYGNFNIILGFEPE